MKTEKLFIKCFDCDEEGELIEETGSFENLGNISYDGYPTNDDGDNCPCDENVYYQTKEGEYKILPIPEDCV